jgi:translation initiation factor 4G
LLVWHRTVLTRPGRWPSPASHGPRGGSREGGSGPRDRLAERGGGGGRGPPTGPGAKPRVVITISQEVELNKAEHAWKPTPKAGGEDVGEVVSMKKAVLAILNKLCPQNFDKLVEKFSELPIDSEAKLQNTMELIFEKAVDEPGFSVAYARMCQVLQLKKVATEGSETESVNFHKLLISRCQKEFDKDYLENLDRDKYRADMAAATTDKERKQVKAVFEQMEMKLRRRSLGNIRFIGELYKLQMLTARIMHECVKKLLKTTDEESLECLCRLLTTVGQVRFAALNKSYVQLCQIVFTRCSRRRRPSASPRAPAPTAIK